jgi:ribosomal protein L37E
MAIVQETKNRSGIGQLPRNDGKAQHRQITERITHEYQCRIDRQDCANCCWPPADRLRHFAWVSADRLELDRLGRPRAPTDGDFRLLPGLFPVRRQDLLCSPTWLMAIELLDAQVAVSGRSGDLGRAASHDHDVRLAQSAIGLSVHRVGTRL